MTKGVAVIASFVLKAWQSYNLYINYSRDCFIGVPTRNDRERHEIAASLRSSQ